MVSIFKTANDLDKSIELQRMSVDCFARAIASAAQYVVEGDRVQAEQFRDHLLALEKALRTASTTENVQSVEVGFRGELRDYRDKTQDWLTRLRQEVSAAASAMKALADNVVSNGADHEMQLQQDLRALQAAGLSEDLKEVRAAILAVTGNMSSTLERMRRNNQFVVAQLQDEIRLLHEQMEAHRRAQSVDPASGVSNHDKTLESLEKLLQQDQGFCLLLVRVRSMKQVDKRYSRNVLESALKAVLVRFQQLAGGGAIVGRWSAEEFVAILSISSSDGMAMSREVTRRLSGDYPVQETGLPQTVILQVATGIVERRAGVDAAKFFKKLEQLSAALADN